MYANSGYTADLFESLGFKVAGVVFPPVDTEKFKPSTKSPSEDYVLTYFGKETKYSTIKRIADSGVRIKAFGGKIAPLLKDVLAHPNIDFLSEVDDSQLVALYSNALFTLFPFTSEPFGYIPVESMACSTPVLSFKWQGPAETIVDGKTGWLAKSDHDMVQYAKRLWKQKYDPEMRGSCREHAKKNFDQAVFVDKFLVILQNVQQME
jgi:glycosyltransferase involved in cell wall biosynthesis